MSATNPRRSAAVSASWVRRRVTLDGRFWDRVDRRAPDECWPWLGSRQTPPKPGVGGYGSFQRAGRIVYAHRRALELSLGRPLGPGMQSLHTCDNPPCCNPAHLFEGTNGDNVRDATAKGRRVRVREWVCPDCGDHVQRTASKVGGRCLRCAAQATRAKRRRAYIASRSSCEGRRVPA